MTKSAAGALRKIWCSHNVSLRTKMRLMRSLVFSIFLYGCESWTLKERDKRRINALEMWCWRQILRISWTEHQTNHCVLQRVGNPPSLLGEVSKRKLRYCGHTRGGIFGGKVVGTCHYENKIGAIIPGHYLKKGTHNSVSLNVPKQ